MMRPILYSLSLILMITSCMNDNDYYVKRTDYVRITEVNIPDSSIVLDTIQIEAFAEADNGCWRDLTFAFDSIADTTYTLAAYGIYESEGTCPEVIVTTDTVIDFIPREVGTYLFYVARNSYQSTIDTLIVSEE